MTRKSLFTLMALSVGSIITADEPSLQWLVQNQLVVVKQSKYHVTVKGQDYIRSVLELPTCPSVKSTVAA